MDFPSKSGSGRIFMNGTVHKVTWVPDNTCEYETHVTLTDGTTLEVTDYEDRFDFIYNPSDDGSVYYSAFVLLDPNEPDPINIPTTEELQATLCADMQPLVDGFMRQEIHSDDLTFCRILFSTPECLLRTILNTGSANAAKKKILFDEWNIS